MTPRQAQGLRWLRAVGKATPTTLRRAGMRRATMDALVARGLARVEHRQHRSPPFGSYPIYTPADE